MLDKAQHQQTADDIIERACEVLPEAAQHKESMRIAYAGYCVTRDSIKETQRPDKPHRKLPTTSELRKEFNEVREAIDALGAALGRLSDPLVRNHLKSVFDPAIEAANIQVNYYLDYLPTSGGATHDVAFHQLVKHLSSIYAVATGKRPTACSQFVEFVAVFAGDEMKDERTVRRILSTL